LGGKINILNENFEFLRSANLKLLSRIKMNYFSRHMHAIDKTLKPAVGPSQPLRQCLSGTTTQGIKRPVREADNSLPSRLRKREAVTPLRQTPSWSGIGKNLAVPNLRTSGRSRTKSRNDFMYANYI
jgi:hypothetical protein